MSAYGLRHIFRFFLAYFEYRHRASIGNLHNLFWPTDIPPTTTIV
jgi:hypothetical protein